MHKILIYIPFTGLVIFSIYASIQHDVREYSAIIYSLAIITTMGIFVYPKLTEASHELKAIRLRILNTLSLNRRNNLDFQALVNAYRKSYGVDVTVLHSVIYDMIEEKSLVIENDKLKINQ